MGDDIEINVTETTNIIEITPQLNDQIVDIAVTDNTPNVEINVTPSVIEINVTRGSSTAIWGGITGNLTDQTDLQSALDLKANLVGGKVPASELPSYVDDIIEVANYAALPTTGETGKIYVTLNNNKIYRWSGSIYIEIAANNAVWGSITGTLGSQMDLQSALNAKFDDPTGDTTQYIAGDGSLITFPVAGQSGTLVRQVRNTTGATLTKGTIVYINGANGNKPTVAKAIATGDSTSAQTFGMLQADLSNNANGYAVCVGDIIGLDTSAITEGTQLYLSSTTAGAYTTTKQVAPAHLVYIGVITRSHPTQGQIEVKIQNGYELDEIHDVLITYKTNNDILTYESSSSLWKNKSLNTILGYTPSNDSNVVHLTGNETISGFKQFTGSTSFSGSSTYFDGASGILLKQYGLSTYNQIQAINGGFQFFENVGTSFYFNIQPSTISFGLNTKKVTFNNSNLTSDRIYDLPNAGGTIALTYQLHDAVTIGTANGLSLSTQALSLALASTSTTGALSSTDWNTFNGKQNTLTNPITGTGTTNYLPKFTGLTTLGNSLIYDNGTNVGIGTASPSGKLHISNSANSTFLYSDGAATGYSFADIRNTGARLVYGIENSIGSTSFTGALPYSSYIGSFATGTAFGIVSGGSLSTTFLSNGNVGIGTTSPSEKLSVIGGNIQLGAGYKLQYSSTAYMTPENNVSGAEIATGGILTIKTGGTTERVRVDASGNVGIGTTSPTDGKLQVAGSSQLGNTIAQTYFGVGAAATKVTSNGAYTIGVDAADGSTERMRITSGGNVLIGTTSVIGNGLFQVKTGGSYNVANFQNGTSDAGYGIQFFNVASSVVGSITWTNVMTSYNITSDYRLKQDFKQFNGLDLVSKIKVYDYEWKADNSRMNGVIAHELQEVVPYAVTGEKDAEQMQSVDYSKLVPILVKAIQELKAEIEILKTK